MRISFLVILSFIVLELHAISDKFVLKSDFQQVLQKRNEDPGFNASLEVFKLSDFYNITIDSEEVAVFNYIKNTSIIKQDYILNTTTNNHWIQLLLNENDSLDLRISMLNDSIDYNKIKTVGIDCSDISMCNGELRFIVRGGCSKRGMIVFNDNEHEPLFVFVDKPISVDSDSTVVFDGYNSGTYNVPSGVNHIHIPLGSYYRGNIISDHDIKLTGYGIISQEGIKHSSYEEGEDNPFKCNVAVRGNSTRMHVYGITSIEPAMYHFWVWPGYGTTYNQVKCFSFLYETDAYIGTSIIDCFTKVNDDNVKLYISDIKVKNLTTYFQGNGHVFQFGWGDYGSRENIVVDNTIVMRDLNNHKECKYVRSLINWRKPDFDNVIKNVCFNGIQCFSHVRSLLVIDNDRNPFKNNPRIKNLILNDIKLYDKPYCIMRFELPGSELKFRNFHIGTIKVDGNIINYYISPESFDESFIDIE